MRRLPLASFLVLALCSSVTAADLSGRWSLDLIPDFGGENDTIACALIQDGARLILNCGGGVNSSGQIRDRTITWQEKTGLKNEFTATFSGQLDERETTISGSWHLKDNRGAREGKFVFK